MQTNHHECGESPNRSRGGGDGAARRAKGKHAHLTLDQMRMVSGPVALVVSCIVGCVVACAVGSDVEAENLGALSPSLASLDRGVTVPATAG